MCLAAVRSSTLTLLLTCCQLAFGCGDSDSATGSGAGDTGGIGGAGGGAGDAGGAGGATAESCTATFSWLQKDAYAEVAGRTSDLWPPHTTTLLEIACDSGPEGALEQVASTFHANHGTEPGEVDAAGDVFLENVKQASADGSREELLALVAAYEACECDPETKFLSLDSLGDEAVQGLVSNLITYLEDNVTCPAKGGVGALIENLQAGEIELVLAEFPSCEFTGASSFEEGLDEALTSLLAASQEFLAGYHVCNNDATLQAELFETYAASGAVVPCDKSSVVCQGPKWLYVP